MINLINRLEDNQDRINALKDTAKDQTAYLITCGPSLTTHNREELLNKLEGKLVIACKQAYEYVKEVSTFHLEKPENTFNHDQARSHPVPLSPLRSVGRCPA